MDFLADLFETPYYTVIFTSVRTDADDEGYQRTAADMMSLASTQPGYLGVETLGAGRAGMTVSYWRDEASIAAWRKNGDHEIARKGGRETWYEDFRLRVAKVERNYGKA